MEACKRVSKTCANGPAVDGGHEGGVRAHVLHAAEDGLCGIGCGQPPRGVKNVQQMFADAGYRDCSVRHYMSRRDRQEAVGSNGVRPLALERMPTNYEGGQGVDPN